MYTVEPRLTATSVKCSHPFITAKFFWPIYEWGSTVFFFPVYFFSCEDRLGSQFAYSSFETTYLILITLQLVNFTHYCLIRSTLVIKIHHNIIIYFFLLMKAALLKILLSFCTFKNYWHLTYFYFLIFSRPW